MIQSHVVAISIIINVKTSYYHHIHYIRLHMGKIEPFLCFLWEEELKELGEKFEEGFSNEV